MDNNSTWWGLVTTLSLAILGEEEELCPPENYLEYEDHFYIVNQNYMSKTGAVTACEELGKCPQIHITIHMVWVAKLYMNYKTAKISKFWILWSIILLIDYIWRGWQNLFQQRSIGVKKAVRIQKWPLVGWAEIKKSEGSPFLTFSISAWPVEPNLWNVTAFFHFCEIFLKGGISTELFGQNIPISWLCNVSGPMVRHTCHGIFIPTHPSPVKSSFSL